MPVVSTLGVRVEGVGEGAGQTQQSRGVTSNTHSSSGSRATPSDRKTVGAERAGSAGFGCARIRGAGWGAAKGADEDMTASVAAGKTLVKPEGTDDFKLCESDLNSRDALGTPYDLPRIRGAPIRLEGPGVEQAHSRASARRASTAPRKSDGVSLRLCAGGSAATAL